jgi:hypothetical protein
MRVEQQEIMIPIQRRTRVMKRVLFLLAMLLVFAGNSPAQGVVSFGVFYSSLDPYGEWIPLDGGAYGWRPMHLEGEWRPYMMGRWAWTSDGWYWASEEPWGWATYHYGRWYYDDFYGWIWIPGYDWAPAWVEWRYGGDYIGWAPLGPYAIWDVHYGIRYRQRWATPYHWWAFVDCRHINDPGLHTFVYRSQENQRYFGRTRAAGNVRYRNGRIETRGPEREFVERRGGIRLERAELIEGKERGERITREGNRDRIEIYRPRVEDRHVDMREKPAKVRESDRRVGLDQGNTDLGVRSRERSPGRDTEKGAILGRPERDVRRESPDVRQPRREDRVQPAPRREPEERSIERQPSGRRPAEPGRVQQQPAPRPAEKARPAPEVERRRPPKEETRSRQPERPTRRPPDARPERGRPGGGGGRDRR